MDRLVRALDREAALAHGREMGAARDEGHVRPALDPPRAEIGADAASPHDRNPQIRAPLPSTQNRASTPSRPDARGLRRRWTRQWPVFTGFPAPCSDLREPPYWFSLVAVRACRAYGAEFRGRRKGP